jgi:hypothetical protein
MTARLEVAALLTDLDVDRTGSRQRFVHRDGRPFTAEEAERIAARPRKTCVSPPARWLPHRSA